MRIVLLFARKYVLQQLPDEVAFRVTVTEGKVGFTVRGMKEGKETKDG